MSHEVSIVTYVIFPLSISRASQFSTDVFAILLISIFEFVIFFLALSFTFLTFISIFVILFSTFFILI